MLYIKVVLADWFRSIRAALVRTVWRVAARPMEPNNCRALIVAPHQDDETLGCGGLLAMKRRMNVPVTIVFLTNGARAEVPGLSIDPTQLVQLRRREALAATQVLGISPDDMHFLKFPDLGLHQPDVRAGAAEQLADIIRDFRPEEIYVTHRNDCHGDHEAAFQITCRAMTLAESTAQLVEYAIWLTWWRSSFWSLRSSELARARKLPIYAVRANKLAALKAYSSQLAGLARGFVAGFRGHCEMYFHAPPVKAQAEAPASAEPLQQMAAS